ncbi:MarR family winged helix-turn-helix transcriptional regulator [Microtetraspora malaysiensis]|uniref:MarR family winged helix-turn-helix transcriptional regulator n=1 Tax=Microtetraspora malaysiensis TaxID=161358 RepID=A0ABW6T5P6_9ACTN|nr:MarR family transcriptional regulator [Microtetraspora malaysiensis]
MEDVVAGVVRQWQGVRPDLDLGPMAVIGRLSRCSALLRQASDALLGDEGLTRPEFDVLAALRRVGGELTPSRLARETFASGAAVTKRVRVLEREGLVARRVDGRDRRVVHLSLTERGRELIDRLLPEQLALEAALLSGLDPERQDRLAAALGELLVTLEGRLGGLVG